MRFLLSIHDVWPGNASLVDEHLATLRGMGLPAPALMVVPEYDGSPPMPQDGEFSAWLRAQQAAGLEIFQHGCRHRIPETTVGADFRGRRSRWGRWINRRWVGGEAEFSGLDPGEGRRLLLRGFAAFRASGIAPLGFVAPTWHGSPPRAALRELDLQIWETRFFLRHLPSGRVRFAPPLVWSAGGKSGEPGLPGGRPWVWALRSLPLVKVVLHPGDLRARGVRAVLEAMRSRARPAAYAEVFRPA